MEDCLFCKIAAGEIPSNKLFEDDKLLAFRAFSRHPEAAHCVCRSPDRG